MIDRFYLTVQEALLQAQNDATSALASGAWKNEAGGRRLVGQIAAFKKSLAILQDAYRAVNNYEDEPHDA
jgi:hypothetical protein